MVNPAAQPPVDYELHEQAYSWEPDEVDIWGSLIDSARTLKARAALIEAFDPSLPAKDRGLAQLGDALIVLKEILDSPGATGWSECEEYVKGRNEDQINLRANTVLLLYRHLEWICRIFAHVPGASVTVR